MDDTSLIEELERRYRTLLPEEYQDSYDDVQPVSMGSAGVRYGSDGKVAWDQMWGSFCDLALAGGPPHKGSLLEPASLDEIEAHREAFEAVTAEISRGIGMVTDLEVSPSAHPGWIRLECPTRGMAAWLLRAITVENVAVRAQATRLELPAGPAYRLHKEIKNVITVIAKTAHYWIGHMSVMHRQQIVDLIDAMEEESPLVAPAYRADAADDAGRKVHTAAIADLIQRETALVSRTSSHPDWLGLECHSVRAASWMVRTLVSLNVLSRREGTVAFVPINPDADPQGEAVSSGVSLVHRLAVARDVFR